MTYGREIVVGAVIILAALGAAMGTLWLKGTNFGQLVVDVDALVEDVGQLTDGNRVKYLGVAIGRVALIEVEQPAGDLVRVRMELEGRIPLPQDAVVVIAPESMFGDWQAEIVSRARFPDYAYADVEPGRIDNGVRVLAGYALPDISRLTATAEAVSNNLATLTDRFDRAFNEETAVNLQRAIGNIQQVSEDIKNLIQQQASTVDELSEHVTTAAADLSEAARVARSTLENADRILASGDVDSLLSNLADASENFDAIATGVSDATTELESTLQRVDSTFTRMDRVTQRIESGEGFLGQLLGDSVLVGQTQSVLASLDALLADFRENPSRYVRLSIF